MIFINLGISSESLLYLDTVLLALEAYTIFLCYHRVAIDTQTTYTNKQKAKNTNKVCYFIVQQLLIIDKLISRNQ